MSQSELIVLIQVHGYDIHMNSCVPKKTSDFCLSLNVLAHVLACWLGNKKEKKKKKPTLWLGLAELQFANISIFLCRRFTRSESIEWCKIGCSCLSSSVCRVWEFLCANRTSRVCACAPSIHKCAFVYGTMSLKVL